MTALEEVGPAHGCMQASLHWNQGPTGYVYTGKGKLVQGFEEGGTGALLGGGWRSRPGLGGSLGWILIPLLASPELHQAAWICTSANPSSPTGVACA